MDIMLIKILDIIINEDDEGKNGEYRKIYLPTLLKKRDIEDVHPGLTMQGKLFKNVTTVKTYSGVTFNAVGNYKKINEILESDSFRQPIGYGNSTKKD